jgi:hypothetical protein
MYSIEPYELGLACIVFTLYISGKVWMYYRIDRDTKESKPKKKGVIKRGPEWPE